MRSKPGPTAARRCGSCHVTCARAWTATATCSPARWSGGASCPVDAASELRQCSARHIDELALDPGEIQVLDPEAIGGVVLVGRVVRGLGGHAQLRPQDQPQVVDHAEPGGDLTGVERWCVDGVSD